MKSLLKKIVKRTPAYPYLLAWRLTWRDWRAYKEWLKNGQLAPPPHIVKQKNIKRIAEDFDLNIFVETGTCLGDMVHAMQHVFREIYSIELDKTLYNKAKYRFRKQSHIHLFHGDSGKILGDIVKRLDEAALFWLDAHYSRGITARGEKDTPIYEELHHILKSQNLGHVILIDDARSFTGKADYPTISELKEFVLSKRPQLDITVEDDCIRIFGKVR